MTVTNASLRQLEHDSIRAFVADHADHLSGRVLDFGCGRSPYEEIIRDAGGDYYGYDRADFPANLSGIDVGHDTNHPLIRNWDAIVCTQVVQYVDDPAAMTDAFRDALASRDGVLLMTGPLHWPCVEPEDRWRLTVNGIRWLLGQESGFRHVEVEARVPFAAGPILLYAGWQAVAFA